MITSTRPLQTFGPSLRLLLAGLGLALPLAIPAPALAQTDSPLPALYTEAQAEQGHRSFNSSCAGCHSAELAASFASYPNAGAFYNFISGSMPADSPGSLAPETYADIVAYMMREIGFPAGDTTLPPDRGVLNQIVPADAARAAEAEAAPPVEEEAPPALPALYTEAQAEQGHRSFNSSCAGCHGGELAESFASYPNAGVFYNFISGSMPADSPGSLAPQTYADIVAYMMREAGFPAGDTLLPPDRSVLDQIIPADAARAAEAEEVPPVEEEAPALPALYTEAQAEQGHRSFNSSCAGCHSAELAASFASYPNAGAFYNFISGSMPADSPGSLAPETYADIVAYMMREIGFPAGDTLLPPDRGVLNQIVPADATAAQ